MKYFDTLPRAFFEVLPQEVDRNNREQLSYAVGANLYMNGLMDLYQKVSKGIDSVGAITICFEDAIREADLGECEANTLIFLSRLAKEFKDGLLEREKLPLIFLRVRNVEQFQLFSARLTSEQSEFLTGFVLPKFTTENGSRYIEQLKRLNRRVNKTLYMMPILESREIVYKETRLSQMFLIREMLEEHRELVLNVRVGGTDFSSAYGLRRSVYSTIYDIRVVSDCLIDIVNVFGRSEPNFVVSGPVWEYFSTNKESIEVQGLLEEVRKDKENGFHGKTSIHPTQAKYINFSYIVSYEEWMDARSIVKQAGEGGVFKGEGGNKMNEVGPHLNWANKVMKRAEVFGVLKRGLHVSDLI